MSAPATFSLEDLTVGFRGKGEATVVLRNVNISLPVNGLVCLMGPNGSGKSSLIRTMAGLQRPLSGKVAVGGNDISTVDRPRLMSVVLTNRIHGVNLAVKDTVAFGRYPYVGWTASLRDADRRAVDMAMQVVGIHPIADRDLSTLSDGQVQMVMIARAIAQETPYIFLDEPTAHLDLNNRLEIMKVLRKLARTEKSIFISTHELDLALQCADEIWLANREKGILRGTPEDLVLNGDFDRVFAFKGFDLRSGRVEPEKTRGINILVEGEGPALLWTRNALERNGFSIHGSTPVAARVRVETENSKTVWSILLPKRQLRATTIAEMIELLGSIDCGIPE